MPELTPEPDSTGGESQKKSFATSSIIENKYQTFQMTLIVIINYVYIYTNNHQYAYEINNIFYLLICLFFVLSKNICILVVSISGAK
jgi:hypothetical protein